MKVYVITKPFNDVRIDVIQVATKLAAFLLLMELFVCKKTALC
jgi:hypothetical protein